MGGVRDEDGDEETSDMRKTGKKITEIKRDGCVVVQLICRELN